MLQFSLQSISISLGSLGPGQAGRIAEVASSVAGNRLLDLGFIPGTLVEVLKRAPLGDPIVYGLRGCRMCLRASEANLIRVELEP